MNIIYKYPFYYLVEEHKWWIFKFNIVVEYSYDLHYLEEIYERNRSKRTI